MKKSFLILALFFTYVTSHAQEETSNVAEDKHEVKLNALFMVIGAFEGTYEYLLNEESGVGVSVFLPFDEDIKDGINYYVSPYYRFYFGNKYASGFFLEGFGMLSSINEETVEFVDGFNPTYTVKEENITDFALGIGLGGKWITKRGLLGEINFGVGRNLFNTSDYDTDFVGKVGITVGYRF